MNTFTASNGITVFVREGGTVQFQHGTRVESCGILQVMPGSEWWEALREFFEAQADERLGRWRSTEHPGYVVHAAGSIDGVVQIVRVVREDSGEGFDCDRAKARSHISGGVWIPFDPRPVARAYFDAHPEPKPWAHAALGDVWEFEIPIFFDPFAAAYQETARGEEWVVTRTGAPVDVSSATSARQVWPVVSDGD